MRKFIEIMARCSELASICTITLMVIITFMQVFFRYVVQDSLTWSEEAARYLFVWTCYLGIAYAVRCGAHLEITVLRVFAGKTIGRCMGIWGMLVTTVFFFYVAYVSMFDISKYYITGQTSTALEIPIYIIWLCLPLGYFSAGIQSAFRMWQIYTGEVELDEFARQEVAQPSNEC